ncbi:MAG: Rha family transcriptional regulator [Rhodocyclaceae bacterium]|nr:Rha family transcriptional regulator [Rhodocyclaceae bacterium]
MQLVLALPNPLAAAQALFLDHGHPITTSRAVAERFGKKHLNVLRDIKNLLAAIPDPEFSRLNFELRDYVKRGRSYPEYWLTKDGFAFLAMRFTGTDAMHWQIAFLAAFNAMEAELAARTARFAHALDQIRPALRPVVEGTEAGQGRSAIGDQIHRSPASITYHRAQARRLGLLAA